MRLGMFGGTFDPVHRGHLVVAEEVRDRLGLDQVLFVPAGRPWFKDGQPVTPAVHRLEMVRRAIEGKCRLTLSDAEVSRPGPSYTADTLEQLTAERSGGVEIYLIVGLDALAEIDRWGRPERVLELSTVVGVSRLDSVATYREALESVAEGAAARVVFVEGPMVDISGTDIRGRVKRGQSIKDLVPASVESYINENRLYRGPDG